MAWEIDAAHSHARFSVRQVANTTIRGQFESVRGYLHVDEQNPTHLWIDVEVDAASVSTGDEDCDARLRAKDVLDVEQFPTISFKSDRVEHVVSQDYKVSGDLTMHGVTRPVTFDVGFHDLADSTSQEAQSPLVALTARSHINCRDYCIALAAPSALGQITVGDPVRIEVELALVARES